MKWFREKSIFTEFSKTIFFVDGVQEENEQFPQQKRFRKLLL